MPTFMKKMRSRNGSTTGVDGSVRTRITEQDFFHIAHQCNGDVREMAKPENLGQTVAGIKQRYEKLVAKGFQVASKSLPPMIYESKRTHVIIDNEKLKEIAREWQSSGGDEEHVAKIIGCSTATIKSKINYIDDQFMAIYHKKLVAAKAKLPENESKSQQELIQDGWDQIEEEGFPSPLCERKQKPNGRTAIVIDPATIDDITQMLETIEVPEQESSEDVFDIDSLLSELESTSE